MLATHYIVLSQTIDSSNGKTLVNGLIGLFDDLQKALDAANSELKKMNAPDEYCLTESELSGAILVDQNGMFTDEIDDDDGFVIRVDVIKARLNHIYTNKESVV